MTIPTDVSSRPVVDEATANAYRAFLRDGGLAPALDPYYADQTVRFELRDGDVLVSPGDLLVGPAPCGALISSSSANARVDVCGIEVSEAEAIARAIDGRRSLREVRAASNVSDAAWTVFVARCFGVAVFAPSAIAFLEARVPVSEIVRFPGSPYEVVRTYWENMGAVRERLEASAGASGDWARFLSLLRELHALSLVGEDGRSFYRPASPIVAKNAAAPGELLLEPSLTEETPRGTRFVSGPRVNATLIGGEHYHTLLSERVSDPGALDAARSIEWAGLEWGRIVTARADADEAAAPWFCPPRPLEPEHFGALARSFSLALQAVARGDRDGALSNAAAVHWAFVRLHPFRFANQCIAMSLVNHVLRRSHGSGIPHLVLDHLALRLTGAAYERAFRRAAQAWMLEEPSALRRLVELISRKRRAFALLEVLRATRSLEEARSAIERHPGDAALLCL